MTSSDQTVFCRFPSDESCAAARYWNTPTSRSARKPTPEFANERSNQSSAGEPQQEHQNLRQLRFAANRNVSAPIDPLSQDYQYAGHQQWYGADLKSQREFENLRRSKTDNSPDLPNSPCEPSM
jgi:hypothetical protein